MGETHRFTKVKEVEGALPSTEDRVLGGVIGGIIVPCECNGVPCPAEESSMIESGAIPLEARSVVKLREIWELMDASSCAFGVFVLALHRFCVASTNGDLWMSSISACSRSFDRFPRQFSWCAGEISP